MRLAFYRLIKMDKITTRDISIGVKLGYLLITVAISAVMAAATIGFSGGQTVQQLNTVKTEVEDLKVKLEDTLKVKEQTAVDIAVIKTKLENIEELLKTKRPWKADPNE